MLITLISFLVVFTIITLVHEAGHLYFSKRAGIRVHEFGVGFGPTLFSTRYHNTTYKINLLPILGYVKIAGIDTEDPEEKDTPEQEKYYNKPIKQKFNSIFAGPCMNLLLGFVILSCLFMITGIPTGISNELATVSLGSEAAKVGLRPGDRLIAINGKEFSNAEEAVALIHQSANQQLTLNIQRDGQLITYKATPQLNKKMKIGLIGFSLKAIYKKVNPFLAIYYGAKETIGLILLILTIVAKLVTGQLAMADIAGPVGIAQITGQYAHQGFLSLLSFVAFFSINVAVLNLLPLPALDGGRLFFILLEAIRRKPFDIETENKIHYVGLLVFLAFFAVLTINDIVRIFSR
jgi:regulator of sigma E protease